MKKRIWLVMALMFAVPVYSMEYFTESVGHDLCVDEETRPMIFMFSETWCSYCEQLRPIYTSTVGEYHDQGLVTGVLWQMEEGDDLFTTGHDGGMPSNEYELLLEFNPYASSPTFVFGCRYYLVGAPGMDIAGWEQRYDQEFREVMDEVLALTCTDTCETLGYDCGMQDVCGVEQSCGICGPGAECVIGFCDCSEVCGDSCGTQVLCGESTDCGTCPCAHSAEQLPCDNRVDRQELGAYIIQWELGVVGMFDLMGAVNAWKNV